MPGPGAGIDWKLEIKEGDSWVEDPTVASACSTTSPCTAMNEILSFVQPKSSNMLYMCGWAYFDPTSETPVFASMFKMDDDGDIMYFYSFGDVHSKTAGG